RSRISTAAIVDSLAQHVILIAIINNAWLLRFRGFSGYILCLLCSLLSSSGTYY
ncbi:Zinc finger BED domain-containing protein DAYSLEEPER, partial [Fusarium oxysporum f. sp. albedinis]